MNAEAYLRRQGWQGSGHSLDSTGRGIKKPLLISHKQDQLGLGKKKAAHTTDDQWWMRAFDASLQTIGSGKESTLSQIRTQGINRGGLYGFFVKGEQIVGTIDDPSTTNTDASAPQSGTNTPPTSASDTEAPAPTKNMSDKKTKRKRADAEADTSGVSEKKNKRVKHKKEEAKGEEPQAPPKATKPKAKGNEQDAVAAKLAKLKPAEKADYEARAAAKKQTLEEYVLRRIQKKAAKHTTEPVQAEAKNPPLFFTDLGGDPDLSNAAPAKTQPTQLLENDGGKSATKKSKKTAQPEPEQATEGTQAEFISLQQPVTLQVGPNTPSFTYTPLKDGSCPLDPNIWKDHKTKYLPKPIKEARRQHAVEQRLAKRMRKAQSDNSKKLAGLTHAEEALLKKKILEEEMGIDAKTAGPQDYAKVHEMMDGRVHKRKGFAQKGSRQQKEEKKAKKEEKAARKAARRQSGKAG